MRRVKGMDWLDLTVLGTALACGLMAGVFFAFSAFVLDGLTRLPDAEGITAMQSINVTAVSPLFMIVLFGAALACVGGVIWAGMNWSDPRAAWVMTGCVVYLVGTIFVTVGANVPLNDTLEGVDPASLSAGKEWADFVDSWTLWNNVRTISALAAAGILTVAVMQG